MHKRFKYVYVSKRKHKLGRKCLYVVAAAYLPPSLLWPAPPSLTSLRQIGGVHKGNASSRCDGSGRLVITLVLSFDNKRFELRRNGCGLFSVRRSGRYKSGQSLDFELGSLFA